MNITEAMKIRPKEVEEERRAYYIITAWARLFGVYNFLQNQKIYLHNDEWVRGWTANFDDPTIFKFKSYVDAAKVAKEIMEIKQETMINAEAHKEFTEWMRSREARGAFGLLPESGIIYIEEVNVKSRIVEGWSEENRSEHWEDFQKETRYKETIRDHYTLCDICDTHNDVCHKRHYGGNNELIKKCNLWTIRK